MKISILGLGQVGGRLAQIWSRAGHKLQAGLRPGSRHEETARHLNLAVAEPSRAVESADVIVLALPWTATKSTLRSIPSLHGRVLLDATNPLAADLSVLVPQVGSGAQQVAAWSGGAKVVKAFNTIGAANYGYPSFDVFYCTDDAEAAQIGHALIADTTMRPVSVGPLKNAAYLEQLAGLWIDLAVHKRVEGAFAFNMVRDQNLKENR